MVKAGKVAERDAVVEWRPNFSLDLRNASPKAFDAMRDAFDEWRDQQARPEHTLGDGWHFITPEIAEKVLLVNPKSANRKAVLSTIVYYYEQMQSGDWPKTGQPVIFTLDADLLDGQHRMWAAYLGGVSFWTYVVNLPEDIPLAFAYIDNGKARSAKDAFQTAGKNGMAGTLAQVVVIAQHYDADAYTATSKHQVPRWSPKQKLDYVAANATMHEGCRMMAGEHSSASAMIGWPDVAAFTAAKVLELYDGNTLDEFMGEVGKDDDSDFQPGSPVAALRLVLEQDRNAREPMKRHQVLAHVIKAFNSWISGEQVKKVTLKVNEAYPHFAEPVQQAAAAE